MIINIRGTSGSGKSTLVRKIVALYDEKQPVFEEGRKQPISYLYTRKQGKPLAVIGHYETACGGCDTITSTDHTFDLVRKNHENCDVIFEGLLISADVNRINKLHQEGYPVKVVALDLPLEECLNSVNERRRAKKPDAPDVNPKNTKSKHQGVKQSLKRLHEAGVPAIAVGREEAFNFIKQELGL